MFYDNNLKEICCSAILKSYYQLSFYQHCYHLKKIYDSLIIDKDILGEFPPLEPPLFCINLESPSPVLEIIHKVNKIR